ncbi:MAG: SDR family oxidoreductase [Microlunatus sp.]|nr:SDR family oxidoreductase [Microlunatus sp.]
MDLGLTDRIALITGGDSGIGLATARLLLQEGVQVVISGLEPAQTEAAVTELSAAGGRVDGFAADLRRPSDVDRLRAQLRNLGRVDILINSAGDSGPSGAFHELEDDDWQATLAIDLMGPVRVTRAFLDDLRSSGHGRLIFLTSENAVQPYPDEIPYDAAKAGVLAMAKALSKAYASDGLLVNCVSPAFIRTPMTDAMMFQRAGRLQVGFDEAVDSFLTDERPGMTLRRRGEPEEVAAVIAFLCSKPASFVNGADYRVDCGSVTTIN